MAKKMTKTEKLKKILYMARYHKEIIVYFGTKYDDDKFPARRRKIRSNGDSYISYKSSGTFEWSKFGESCFLCQYNGPKSLPKTLDLMKKHDGNYIFPVAIEIDGRKIEL